MKAYWRPFVGLDNPAQRLDDESMTPEEKADYLTQRLRGKTVAEVNSRDLAEVEIRFTDGTRLCVEKAESGFTLSIPSEPGSALAAEPFSAKQGQYLAFIHSYSKLNGRPPAEAEIQRFFNVTPPSVHQMILKLESRGLINREPGKARSIVVLVPEHQLPTLNAAVPRG
jgi:DNA-binding MarR family transcriptional regulator